MLFWISFVQVTPGWAPPADVVPAEKAIPPEVNDGILAVAAFIDEQVMAPATPTPPETTTAPVEVEVLGVVFVKLAPPESVNPPVARLMIKGISV